MKRLLLGLVVGLLACGGTTEPTPHVSGSWAGSASGQAVALTLIESNGTITGNGTLAGTPTGTRAMTVNGVFTNPTFNLSFTSGTLQPVNFTGHYNGSIPAQLVGNFSGSGFTGEVVILLI